MLRESGVRDTAPIADQGVYVWLAHLDDPTVDVAWCCRVLSTAERDRASRFAFVEHRRRYVVSHAALRSVLASCLRVPPEDLQFSTRLDGKPVLTPPCVQFNLSHSNGVALIAVARTRQVGVDVERVSQDVPVLELARRFLSAEAVAVLAALPTSLRRLAFFKCWTAGEAFAKARGTGLDEEANGFEIVPTQDGARVVGTASNWSLSELQLPDGYVGAVVSENRASVARLDRSPDGGDGAGAIDLQAWLWRKPLVARSEDHIARKPGNGAGDAT
jgi:4'-phosphopantetheinyl transferase